MKKGDIKKQEILNTAEELFCKNGYEETSVQDILDRIQSSKGSFYHHFISKEAVLESICRRRAKEVFERTDSLTNESECVSENLNILLSGMIPFRNDIFKFLMMILPIFRLTEGRMVKAAFCDALANEFESAVYQQLILGNHSGEIACQTPDLTARLLIDVINHLWTKICDIILISEEGGNVADISEILRITDCFRLVAERMISLQYGTLKLIDIPTIHSIIFQIHIHWAQ